MEEATQACQLSEWKRPPLFETLAAAYAEAGDFANAVKWESAYLQTPKLSAHDMASGQDRLALYRTGKPYRTDQPAYPN